MYILSGPPSCVTASTKRSWSSTVHRRRGLGSVVRTRPDPESPCTHIACLSFELTAAAAAAAAAALLVAFLEGNILSILSPFHAPPLLSPSLSRQISRDGINSLSSLSTQEQQQQQGVVRLCTGRCGIGDERFKNKE